MKLPRLPRKYKPEERQRLPQPGVDLKAFNLASFLQLAEYVSVTQPWSTFIKSGCSQETDF